jgi:hypothetical protein
MASKYWIKLYVEILDDPKMGMLPDRLYRRTIELFLIAGETDQEGTLPPTNEISWRLRIPESELTQDLQELKKLNIASQEGKRWMITKFAERQAPVSDAERMRRLRDRKQKDQYHGYEPVTNPVTNPVTKRNVDTDTDTDTDTELINTHASDKNPESQKNQEGSINASPVPSIGTTGDELDQFIQVYETTMGEKILPYPGLVILVNEMKQEGVTPEIYRDALLGLKANGYTVSNMGSAKNWAIKDAREKRNPRTTGNRKNGNGLYLESMSAKWNEKTRKEKVESLTYMRLHNRLKPETEQEAVRLGLIKETK